MNDTAKAAVARDRELPLLEQAVEASPRDAGAQARLALLYAQKNLRDKAAARIQTALALAPDDPDVLENVGETYETLGDRKRAVEYIGTSLKKGFSLETLEKEPALKGLLSDPNFRASSK